MAWRSLSRIRARFPSTARASSGESPSFGRETLPVNVKSSTEFQAPSPWKISVTSFGKASCASHFRQDTGTATFATVPSLRDYHQRPLELAQASKCRLQVRLSLFEDPDGFI